MAQTFNTKIYDWSETEISLGGRVLTGVRGVSYKTTQEKEFIYGKGDKPQAIKRGNKAYEGQLMLLQDELETLILTAPNRDITDLRGMSVAVSYKNEEGSIVTDTLTGVEFTEVDKALNQNAKFMEVTLPIMFLDVRYGA